MDMNSSMEIPELSSANEAKRERGYYFWENI